MAVAAGQDQPFPFVNSFSDFINRFEDLLTCPACNLRLQEPMLLTCDHVLCRMCIPTSESVVCPKCNIISHFKDIRRSIFMEEMVKISKEVDSSLSDIPEYIFSKKDIPEDIVFGNVSIAAENSTGSMPNERKNLVLLGCALNPYESGMLMKFATQNSGIINQFWRENVTHVVISSDNSSTFRRAFEFLMAILFGKWVVSIEWIKACFQEVRLMPEEPYEVNHDLRGSFDGPKKGRIRVTNKAPKLFAGLGFFLSSYLEPLIRTRLEEVLVAAGGTIIEKMENLLPIATLGNELLKKYIVINEEEPLSSGDICKSIDERSEEVLKFYKKIGSPRFIGYTIIADAIAALDSAILDKEYGGDWDGLICKAEV